MNELDLDILKQWSYEAAHDVAIIRKKLTAFMYESQIKFRHLAGTSAGGRTTLGEMQRYPEDNN